MKTLPAAFLFLGLSSIARVSLADCDPSMIDCGGGCCFQTCCATACCDDPSFPYCCPDGCGNTPDCGVGPPPPPPSCGSTGQLCGSSHCTNPIAPVCCASIGHEELGCPMGTQCVARPTGAVVCRDASGNTMNPTNGSGGTVGPKPKPKPFTERTPLDEDPPRSCALGSPAGSSGALTLLVAVAALAVARRRRPKP